MPVLSAVLTLSARREQDVLSALSSDPRVTLGAPHGLRHPVVLSSQSRGEDRVLWAWATGLPGVLLAELTFADFSDLHDAEGSP